MSKSTKVVAILQSNYIPWKGYFDIIASVDEFIIYDDVQFTKNDWRNRNKIKTSRGVEWITIPVGQNIRRHIREVELTDSLWQQKHWRMLYYNYRSAMHFEEVAALFEPMYLQRKHTNLSMLNRALIEAVCGYLGITTTISNSWEYDIFDGKTERLADLCAQAGGAEYISGPSGIDYIDVRIFAERGIKVTWFDYDGYPEYPQLWGEFVHGVTILDLLFNCGKDSRRYMRKNDQQ